MKHGRTAGLTLVEMMMVVAIIAMIGALAFPAVTSGLETVRLSSASDSIVSFLNAGLTRAERRQTPVEILISIPENKIRIQAVDMTRELAMPDSIHIVKIHPELPSAEEEEQVRSIVLYPNGAIPRFGVEITSPKGIHRIVRVDPVTGVPQIEIPQPKE